LLSFESLTKHANDGVAFLLFKGLNTEIAHVDVQLHKVATEISKTKGVCVIAKQFTLVNAIMESGVE